MDLLEDQGHGYILGLPGNARLSEIGQPWCEDAALRRVQSGKDKVRRFFQTGYQAKSWSRERKVVARVEATARGTDVRFSSSPTCRAAPNCSTRGSICARGRMENMIKEHKLYTKSDRTSCHRWEANQFRLFLHTAAYWLLHQLRRTAPSRSPWRTATFETLRRAFLKIAVRIEELNTRIKIALPSAYPYRKRPDRDGLPPSPPKAPDPSGACRRMNLERQSPTRNENPPRKPPSTRPIPLASLKSAAKRE